MLHEKPDQLIQSAIDGFEIKPDILTLNRIDETIEKTSQNRSSKIDELVSRNAHLKSQLQSLSNELAALSKPSGLNYEILNSLGEKDDGDHDNSDIFTLMNRKLTELDHIKVSLAKGLNDLESQVNALHISQNNLVKVKQNLATKYENLISHSILNNRDSKVMKINLYKNLGVIVEEGKPATEGVSAEDKIIVHNRVTDITSILSVDDKYSDYFISNHIWDQLPGK